jgi:long-chain acyl-CoA synthetase
MQVAFYGGDITTIIQEDIPYARPTMFVSVPRLFNRIYDILKMKFDSEKGPRGELIRKAIATKLKNLHTVGTVTHALYDRLIFDNVKMMLGGRVRLMGTGSAPIAQEVMDLTKIAFCCPVSQGYGMTETSFSACGTDNWDINNANHVGCTNPALKLRLKDVPEMGYYSTNDPPTGEICLKG